MRCIDADALKESIRKALGIKSFICLLPSEKAIIDQIDDAPTVEPPKPKRESRAMLPCTCGCRRREHWFGADYEALVCKQCGRKVSGKNAMDAIRNWNREMGADDNADAGEG